ncbi:porin family protein [Olleya sp. Hel_I_94]|uniref:porin family protein n=1 Tax=Olleya sp. Hel_I_94 TaxID=1250001 RepID=UPI0011AC04BB|nr:porin family protein [Olleya sp. Hel_I_94]TVZ47481.1 outer membrane protein with beta-barrel domain [Olleya sp. Hel_I_94]
MKKSNYILLFIFLMTFNLTQAQEVKESKFNIIAYGGIGYGIVENDEEPNYNLNTNNAELLLNYRVSQAFGIGTGIGINELSGNGFNSIGNFYQERTLLKIPLLLTMNSKISDNFTLFANFGFYGQNIIKDEYRYIADTQKNIYDGWNFGAQLGLGFVFKMFDNFSAGINYTGQSDFSKFESNDNQGINDNQKIKNLNSVGVILMIEL